MMVGLFLPIYLYQNLPSINYLFLFYVLVYAWALIWLQFVVFWMRVFGADLTLVLASLCRAVSMFIAPFVVDDPRWIFGLALFFGMTIAFDWLPYHYTVTALSQKKRDFGKKSSYITIMEKLAGAVGPILGALLITYWGYAWLYGVSAVMLLFSALAPLLDEFDHDHMHFKWSEIAARFQDPGIKKHLLSHGLSVFDITSYTIVWPLILIGGFGTVMKSGMFQSFTLVIALIILMWMSRYLDKGNYGVMKIGSILGSMHWWVRFLFRSPFGLAVAEVLNSLGQVMLWTPFASLIYQKGVEGYKMEFFYVRQLIRLFLSTISVLFLWIVFNLVPSLEFMMLVFGFVMLGTVGILGMFKKA